MESEDKIWIEEWKPDPNDSSRFGIIELMVECFSKSDQLTRVIRLSKDDLYSCAETLLGVYQRVSKGLVLTALCEDANGNRDIVGALIGLPTNVVPPLNWTPNLCILDKYFEYCYPSDVLDQDTVSTTAEPASDNSLNLIMLSVSEERISRCIRRANPSLPNASQKLVITTVFQLESCALKFAKEKGFNRLDTLNTSIITQVCSRGIIDFHCPLNKSYFYSIFRYLIKYRLY